MTPLTAIPRDRRFDSTLSLFSEGYTFVSERCARYGSDIFETRVMLRKAFCTMGEDAARMFYYPDRFARSGAIPLTAVKLLQDKGSVQTLQASAHRRRKEMFMALMSPESISALAEQTTGQWRNFIKRWEKMDQVVLHPQVQSIMCRAVCDWAGIPLTETETQKRTAEMGAMIEGAGKIGPGNWKAQLLRRRTERWAREAIAAVRTGKLVVREGCALQLCAWHRDANGRLMDLDVAAVELINILRPTVAVAHFVTFAALALHRYMDVRRKLQKSGDEYLEWFVWEVRRYYPFFPLIGGFAREAFDWRGHQFAAGDLVYLDLYGTNHDPRIWGDPEYFRPERFRDWDGSAFNYIPQGGGDYVENHRCPGEWITLALMKNAVRMLTSAMTYDVPEQNLRIDLSKMPTLPQSGFIIHNVQRSSKFT